MKRTTFAIALAALLAPSFASAYQLLGPARRWLPPTPSPRVVTVDSLGMPSITDSDLGVTAAVAAVEKWNTGSVNVTDGVAGLVVYVLGDNRSDLIFDDPLHICTGTCLAATTIGYYDSAAKACCDGVNLIRITDSDVAFNRSYNWTSASEPDGCSGEFYVEAVTTHEIGHVIGLGHSNLSSALMYPSVSACVNKVINSDDTAGRNVLYDCAAFNLGPCATVCKVAGSPCSSDAECCSRACRGRPIAKVCK